MGCFWGREAWGSDSAAASLQPFDARPATKMRRAHETYPSGTNGRCIPHDTIPMWLARQPKTTTSAILMEVHQASLSGEKQTKAHTHSPECPGVRLGSVPMPPYYILYC